MKTEIFGNEVELTKDELHQFAFMEYDSLSKKELIEWIIELDMKSSSYEKQYKALFEDYNDEDRQIILNKIRK